MKNIIKKILLFGWILVSLKIVWLSGPYTLGFFLSAVAKILHMPYGNYFIATYFPFTEKEYVLGSELSQYMFLSMVRGFTDLLLMTFVINGWIFYFLKKQKNIKLDFDNINKNILVSLVLIGLYLWYIQDIFIYIYFNEIVEGLENTFFFFFLIFLLTIIFLLNILIMIQINNKNLSFLKKIIYGLIFLFINGTICQTVALALIYKDGGLGLTLYNSEILNNPYVKGPKDLNGILLALYQSYGLNITWCNPNLIESASEIPCLEIRRQLETSCTYTDIINQLPIGGKTVRGQITSQIFQIGIDKLEGCSKLRSLLDVCMEDHMRGEFARRWMEAHLPAKPKSYVGNSVIDTWSAHIRK